MNSKGTEKPECYGDDIIFSYEKCESCPWYYPCGNKLGWLFSVSRKEMIQTMLVDNLPPNDPDVVAAIVEHYFTSETAAKLAIRRERRRLELEGRRHKNG